MSEAYYAPLVGKKIQADIIYHAQPHIIYDKMSIPVSSDKGVYEYMKMDNADNLSFKPLGPAAALENDVLKFTKTTISINEEGIAPRIPISTIEDQNVDIVAEVSKELGRSYAKKLNKDFLDVANAGVANSESITKKWTADDSTPFRDLLKLQNKMSGENYIMDTIAFNPSSRFHLIVDPDYAVQTQMTKTELKEYTSLDPLRVLNATTYTTTQQTAGTVLGVDSKMYCLSIQRSPLTVELEKEPGSRQVIVNAWLRHEFSVIRDKAGATLTSVI